MTLLAIRMHAPTVTPTPMGMPELDLSSSSSLFAFSSESEETGVVAAEPVAAEDGLPGCSGAGRLATSGNETVAVSAGWGADEGVVKPDVVSVSTCSPEC